MSRKFALSLVALATLASAALVAGSAQAMVLNHGGQGGHGNPGGHYTPHYWPHPHHNHYVWRHRHLHPVGYVVRTGYVERVATPGPCTCLTKDYTPDGIVVFKDLCTKEMASAPVDGAPAKASENADPNNFAGKTYQDYLAANPQAKAADTQKN